MGKRGCKPKKHFRKKRGVVILRLPRYTDEEIEQLERELRELIESGKAKFKPDNEFPEFKNVEVVSVFVEDLILGKAHCQMVKGKKVYVKPYHRKIK